MEPSGDVTRLLSAWTNGDQHATDELLPLVYGELHRIARRFWNGQPHGHTLQPTALIHEAYLKLVSRGEFKTFKYNLTQPCGLGLNVRTLCQP